MSALGSRRISEIMDKKLVAISPKTTVRAAIKLAKSSGVNLLLVLDAGKLVGVVGEEDLLDVDLEKSVQGIVKRPIFAEEDDTVAVAIGKTIDNNLTRLPVVDSMKNMRCVGVVTATELLKEASKER
ncbi:MAG: HPP family protein [Candidatus Micrarchaeales archaeon]